LKGGAIVTRSDKRSSPAFDTPCGIPAGATTSIPAPASFFTTHYEASASLQDKVELVCALVSVCRLSLTRLQTVQANHDMLALPQSGFVKLLRLRTGVLLPVDKVIHKIPFNETLLVSRYPPLAGDDNLTHQDSETLVSFWFSVRVS
jgi:hypothetical protein